MCFNDKLNWDLSYQGGNLAHNFNLMKNYIVLIRKGDDLRFLFFLKVNSEFQKGKYFFFKKYVFMSKI